MRLTLWAGFWAFMLDQASKYLVVHWLNLRERGEIDVLSPLLNFRMAWNKGVNFGLLSNSADLGRWLLIGLALAICVWVFLWIKRENHSRLAQVSAGLLIGGALGNVMDRVLYGAVADFINMSCCGIENPYSFNIADIAVFVGAFGLIFFAGEKKTR
ncbi:lipoprotein signal peptidase [Marinosulfonomonas sp. PRT-SC04]|nr:lipoprotein signal peptidase [Marinosulfonomonas sp. PRT-SC04]